MGRPVSRKRSQEPEASGDTRFGSDRSPIPLYHRIYVILRERIVNGTYKVGQTLPSEAELMERFGVSRITARRALDELSLEGLVDRVRGRGTQVSAGAAPRVGGVPIIAGIDGLMANLSIIGQQTTVEVFEFAYVVAPDTVATEMQLGPTDLVQRAVRVRSLADGPFSMSTTFVLERIGRTYTQEELVAIPLIDLITRAGTAIGHVKQSITAALADEISAQRLGVQPGSPLLKLRRVFYDADNRPVDYVEIFYRPDRFEYRMTLSRGADNKFQLDRS
ncbi:GntR family transcriptional regulator [Microvirga antarctica]|uniref:GntR family transcriptional regulator n=1 Tax=Microvirga antarctica TaxID=2819233 RepID=UPI001B314EC0|nr:GntR family transcriptional regulator [Microvirga antarctica]